MDSDIQQGSLELGNQDTYDSEASMDSDIQKEDLEVGNPDTLDAQASVDRVVQKERDEFEVKQKKDTSNADDQSEWMKHHTSEAKTTEESADPKRKRPRFL